MGCHIFDPVFESIGLTTAVSVRSEGPPPNQWNWALNGKVHYHFSRHTSNRSENFAGDLV